MHTSRVFAFAFCMLTTLPGCTATSAVRDMQASPVAQDHMPSLRDDLDFIGLDEAIAAYLRDGDFTGGIRVEDREFDAAHLRRTAKRLEQVAKEARRCVENSQTHAERDRCHRSFQTTVAAEFDVFALSPAAEFTAYYTPTLVVSRRADPIYRFPLYALPASAAWRTLSRAEIDFDNALAGQKLELFYARDRYDVYVAHVEGGARVEIDGEPAAQRYLSYAGSNGREFRLIHEYMHAARLLTNDISRHAQRRFLAAHPDREREIYASCPAYFFFRETDRPPVGSNRASLWPGRSLASDPSHYPKGLIMFVSTRRPRMPPRPVSLESNPPNPPMAPLTRFFIDQDEGPYIKGPGRFDLFFGEDEQALYLANNLHTYGQVHFFILKH